MSNSASIQIGVGKRITIVDKVGVQGNGSNGQSLRGLNVQDYPDGCLFYVRDSNRMYKLKKHQAVAIVEDSTGMDNVVNGIGSDAVNGRFVALVQMGLGTLVSGEPTSSVVIAGFDVNPGGWFHVTHVTFAGTVGFLRAAKASETTVEVFATTDDTSDVFVTYYETPEGE